MNSYALLDYSYSLFYILLLPVLNTEQHGSKWEIVGVVDNSQRGSRERVREKMVKISERAAALVGERQQVEEALAISEERVREEGQRAQQAERRY